MALGKQIKQYREKLGWTLQQLSEASDVDVGTIFALEKRDSTRSKFFIPLAKAFGLTLEELSDESTVHDVVNLQVQLASKAATISESAAPWTWPFKTVTPRQYELLDDADREQIEKHVMLYVMAREDPAKQIAPANYIARVQTA